jgi:methylmalonyl-CoA mutase N-terminal domain/subunit
LQKYTDLFTGRNKKSLKQSILGWSYYVERLTHEIAGMWKLIEEVEELGGLTKTIKQGSKLRIEEAATKKASTY